MTHQIAVARRRRLVLSELEERVAQRWCSSPQRSRDNEPFPRTLLRAALLHAENPDDAAWSAALQESLRQTLWEWWRAETTPARIYALLAEVVNGTAIELARNPADPSGASLCERLESVLLNDFASRWREFTAEMQSRAVAW